MGDILIIYASVEGQTRRIADNVAERLRARGHRVNLLDAAHPPHSLALERLDAVLLGGAVHYGRHPRRLARLARRVAAARGSALVGFFSVSGIAADGSDESRRTAQGYADAFLATTGLKPDLQALFAGAVRFSRYNPVKRWVMRRIQARRGADTDTSRDYEYTDWDDVRAFADRVADRLAARASEQDVDAQEDGDE